MLIASNYHYIRNSFESKYPSIFGLTPDEFKLQVEAMAKIGKFIHPKEILTSKKKIASESNIFWLLTFDDGLKEQYQLAYPILKELGIPAIFFINPINVKERIISFVHQFHILRSNFSSIEIKNCFFDLIDKNLLELSDLEKAKANDHYKYDDNMSSQFKYLINFKLSNGISTKLINYAFKKMISKDLDKINRKLYMSEAEIKKLGYDDLIGSHSYRHLKLSTMKDDELDKEISYSSLIIKNIVGKIPYSFSYPYGSFDSIDSRIIKLLKNNGYEWGITMERAINIDFDKPYLLSRFSCNDLPGGKGSLFNNKNDIIKNKNYRSWSL